MEKDIEGQLQKSNSQLLDHPKKEARDKMEKMLLIINTKSYNYKMQFPRT